MSDTGKVPDKILDIRVRMPAGLAVVDVTGAAPGAHSPRVMIPIEAIHTAIDRKLDPVITERGVATAFETGKNYRAAIGALMKITSEVNYMGFTARQVEDGRGDPNIVTVRYTSNGIATLSGWSGYNLFYGAVEDDNSPGMRTARAAAIDIEDGLDEASREHKERLQNLVDGAHIRCDVLTDRVVTLEGKVDGEIKVRLDVIVNRIKAVSNALQGTDHEGENVKRRLTALESHTGRHAMATVIDRHTTELGKYRGLLLSLIGVLGMEVGDFGRVRMKRHSGDDPPRQDEATIKPVIKGGWFNVYLYEDGAIDLSMTFSNMWTTQDAALRWMRRDVRFGNRKAVACIQIPDITEGEGL